MAEDRDLSKIRQCVDRLCGNISSSPPPQCDKDECPGKLWRLLRAVRDTKEAQ